MLNDIVVLGRPHPQHALATTVLQLVGVKAGAFDVPVHAQGNHHVRMGDQLVSGESTRFFFNNLSPALVPKLLAKRCILFFDRCTDH